MNASKRAPVLMEPVEPRRLFAGLYPPSLEGMQIRYTPYATASEPNPSRYAMEFAANGKVSKGPTSAPALTDTYVYSKYANGRAVILYHGATISVEVPIILNFQTRFSGKYAFSVQVGDRVVSESGRFQLGFVPGVAEIHGQVGHLKLGGGRAEGIYAATVYLDLNENGSRDRGEPYRRTDSTGYYRFAKMSAGFYPVRFGTPAGMRPSDPQRQQELQPTYLIAGQTVDRSAYYTRAALISGSVFADRGTRGVRDAADALFKGISGSVFDDANNNGVPDTGESQSHFGRGAFAIDVPAGTGRLRIHLYGDLVWAATAPATASFAYAVVAGQVVTEALFLGTAITAPT